MAYPPAVNRIMVLMKEITAEAINRPALRILKKLMRTTEINARKKEKDPRLDGEGGGLSEVHH